MYYFWSLYVTRLHTHTGRSLAPQIRGGGTEAAAGAAFLPCRVSRMALASTHKTLETQVVGTFHSPINSPFLPYSLTPPPPAHQMREQIPPILTYLVSPTVDELFTHAFRLCCGQVSSFAIIPRPWVTTLENTLPNGAWLVGLPRRERRHA